MEKRRRSYKDKESRSKEWFWNFSPCLALANYELQFNCIVEIKWTTYKYKKKETIKYRESRGFSEAILPMTSWYLET